MEFSHAWVWGKGILGREQQGRAQRQEATWVGLVWRGRGRPMPEPGLPEEPGSRAGALDSFKSTPWEKGQEGPGLRVAVGLSLHQLRVKAMHK